MEFSGQWNNKERENAIFVVLTFKTLNG